MFMKKIFLVVANVLIFSNLLAQLPCSTDMVMQQWLKVHPENAINYFQHRKNISELDKTFAPSGYSLNSAIANSFTIPIVFHILHLGGGENISDAQVQDAVRILNEDFNANNADTASVVHEFKNLIGNTQVHFQLATKDPNGNCTNGIVRHYDHNTDWPMVDFSTYQYTWNPNRYLNIYVVRTISGGQAAGYTFLPGSGIPQVGDAIVILHNYVGSIGSGNYGLARALTHEVGHWFDLEHTWGSTNQPGVSCGDDGVFDTPFTMGHASCNLGNGNICNPQVQENIQNYMEYAYCSRMFTIGQSFRMQQCLNGVINGRNNLWSNANLIATGIVNPATGCNTQLAAIASSYTVCAGNALSLKSFTWNAAPSAFNWSATNGANFNTPNAQSTYVTFSQAGIATISCTAQGPVGPVTETFTVLVKSGSANYVMANTEPFEFFNLPFYWNTYNFGSTPYDWEITGDGKYSGTNCIMVPGEKLAANATVALESPSYDFLHNQGAMFSFWFSYARASSFHNDRFKVQASKDCGGSWSDIWVPSIATVANLSGGIKSGTFSPMPYEWSKYILTNHPAFIPFLNEANVHIRFVFTEDENGSGFGNRFYLDEVNFSGGTSISENTLLMGLNLSPNPTNGQFNVTVYARESVAANWLIIDICGKVVAYGQSSLEGGTNRLAFNQPLAPGVYVFQLEVNGHTVQQKLIID